MFIYKVIMESESFDGFHCTSTMSGCLFTMRNSRKSLNYEKLW